MEPAPPADPAAPRSDRARECVVCSATVPPELDACPSCHEPSLRWCTCMRAVWIDERACPGCGRVLPRYPTLGVRAQEKRRKAAFIGALVLLPIATLAVVFGPDLIAMSDLASRRAAGMEAAAAGRHEDAVPDLAAWVRANPADAEALAALGRALLAAGDASGATELQRAIAADPTLPGIHLILAEHFARAGDLRSALDHALSAPEPRARVIAARAERALRLAASAARSYDDAVAAYPRDIDLAAEAAAAHGKAASYGDARRHRERARELWRTVATALRSGGPVPPERAALLAQALAGAGDPGVADAFAAALAVSPGDSALRIEAYRALVAAGDTAAARAILDDPAAGTTPQWRVARARELVGPLPRDLRLPGGPAGEARRAAAEDAVSAMYALVAEPGKDVAATAVLVRALTLLGRHAEARKLIDPALAAATRRDPEMFEAAGDAHRAAGDLAGAARCYTLWRAAAPEDPAPLRSAVALGFEELCAIRRAPALSTAASAAVAAGAERALSDLRSLDPDSADVLRWDAILLDAGAQHREADALLARIARIEADDEATRMIRIRRACDGTGSPNVEQTAGSPPPEGLAGPDAAPEDVRAFCTFGLAGGHADVVEPFAALAVARLPEDVVLRRALASSRIVLGRFDQAVACLDPADPVVSADDDLTELRIVALAMAGRLDALAAEPAGAGSPDTQRPGGRIVGAGFALAGDVGRAAELLAPGGIADPAADGTAERRRARAERLDDAGLGALALPLWTSIAGDPAGDGPVRARALAGMLDETGRGSPAGTALRQRAAEAATRLAEGSPDDRAAGVYLTAVIAAREGDFDGAVTLFRRALSWRAGFLDADRRIGTALAATGRPAEAVVSLRAHVATRPAAVAARRLLVEQFAALGLRQIAAGENDDARTSFAAARRHGVPAIDAAARTATPASTGLLGFGLPRHAVDALAARAPRAAADPAAAAAFAVLIADDGRGEQALAIAQELIARDPDRPWAWMVRGVVRLAGRNASAALEDFGEAERRGEKSHEFRTARALALLLAGRRSEALLDVSVSLDLAPTERFAATVAAALGDTSATAATLQAADAAWAAQIRAAAAPR